MFPVEPCADSSAGEEVVGLGFQSVSEPRGPQEARTRLVQGFVPLFEGSTKLALHYGKRSVSSTLGQQKQFWSCICVYPGGIWDQYKV